MGLDSNGATFILIYSQFELGDDTEQRCVIVVEMTEGLGTVWWK